MPSHTNVLEQLNAIAERLGLGDIELASLVGIAPHTLRCARLAGGLPPDSRCARAVAAFVERNKRARRRAELRLADRGAP